MGGVLTHTAIGLAGFLIIYFISRKWFYGTAFFVGHLAPDSIRVIITMIAKGLIDVNDLLYESLFWKLEFTHLPIVWILITIIAFAVIFVLYKLKKVNKKQLKMLIITDALFLAGIILHYVADALIFETNRWI